jgi:nitronate monooxygenase
MLIDGAAKDIVYTAAFSGVPGSYLRASIEAVGLDPDDLPAPEAPNMDFGSNDDAKVKAWRDIWSAGQGIGGIHDAPPVAELVDRLAAEFDAARDALV